MKNRLILFTILFSSTAFAQSTIMPSQVQDAFYARYPNAQDMSWYKDDGNYKIDFYEDVNMFTALYDEKGVWIETASIIGDDKIPDVISAKITRQYPDGDIALAEKVINTDNEDYYRITVEEDATYILKVSSEGLISIIQTIEPEETVPIEEPDLPDEDQETDN